MLVVNRGVSFAERFCFRQVLEAMASLGPPKEHVKKAGDGVGVPQRLLKVTTTQHVSTAHRITLEIET